MASWAADTFAEVNAEPGRLLPTQDGKPFITARVPPHRALISLIGSVRFVQSVAWKSPAHLWHNSRENNRSTP